MPFLSKRGGSMRRLSDQRNSFLNLEGIELPLQNRFGRSCQEQPKIIVKSSRFLVLARCSIHILPVTISIAIICLNLSHSYLGRTLPGSIVDPAINIALLQVAAKAQELLITASVGTIIVHSIRQALLAGDGVPLGMLGGSFVFTRLSYFWSPELWGSLGAHCSLVSRYGLFGLFVVGGVITTLAGPSSAILMIPREQTWNAGGTSIFLPGPEDVWWPDVYNGSRSGAEEICSTSIPLSRGICSNGGYQSFWHARDVIDVFGNLAYVPQRHHNLTTNLIFGPRELDLTDDFSLSRGLRYLGNLRGYPCETAVVGVRTIEAMHHHLVLRDWRTEVFSIPWSSFGNGSKFSQYKYYTSLTATTSSQIPAVRVTCTPAQKVSIAEKHVKFPVLHPNGCSHRVREAWDVHTADLNGSPAESLRTTWVDVPGDLGTVSIGILVELPWDRKEKSRAFIGCSVDARWAKGNIITSDLRSFSTSSNLLTDFEAPIRLGPVIRESSTAMGEPDYSEFRPVLLNPASRRIRLGPKWLYSHIASSNDSTAADSGWTQKNLENLLGTIRMTDGLSERSTMQAEFWNEERPGNVNRTVTSEWILALLVADSLSRVGSERVVNTTGTGSSWIIQGSEKVADFQAQLLQGGRALKRPSNTGDIIEAKIHITIGGYSYRASSTTDYCAIALLCFYVVLAISHIIHVMGTGKASNAWATLTELMAILQNSRPAPMALRNTNGGIDEWHTYGQVARLFTTKTTAHEEDDISNVEIIFDEPNNGLSLGRETGDVWKIRRPSQQVSISKISEGPRSYDDSTCKISMASRNLTLGRVQPDIIYGHPKRRLPLQPDVTKLLRPQTGEILRRRSV